MQLEIVHRRQAAGLGSLTLDRVRVAVEGEIAHGTSLGQTHSKL